MINPPDGAEVIIGLRSSVISKQQQQHTSHLSAQFGRSIMQQTQLSQSVSYHRKAYNAVNSSRQSKIQRPFGG